MTHSKTSLSLSLGMATNVQSASHPVNCTVGCRDYPRCWWSTWRDSRPKASALASWTIALAFPRNWTWPITARSLRTHLQCARTNSTAYRTTWVHWAVGTRWQMCVTMEPGKDATIVMFKKHHPLWQEVHLTCYSIKGFDMFKFDQNNLKIWKL